jgi:DEAD_2
VYASRSQLCVHGSIKNMSGVVQQAACDNAVRQRTCTYWTHAKGPLEQKVRHLENIADIEDLVHVGVAKHVRSRLTF